MASNFNDDSFIIRYCRVDSVQDDAMGYRLKVRIPYYDPTFSEDPLMETIPYCFPLLPKLLHVYPKQGEMVFVIFQEQGSTQGDRFFIGPVISQDYYMYECNFETNAKKLLQGINILPPEENPKNNPDNDGTIPDREAIAIRGRNNSDIVLLDDELRLRCGFKKYPYDSNKSNCLNFNEHDMAYIQMKYFPSEQQDELGGYRSVANIVADRINLLSYDGKPGMENADKSELINENTQNKIQGTMHNMVYGDDLVDYLKKVINLFSNHVHPFHGMRPCFISSEIDVLNTDLTKYLSKTIKIN